MFRKVCSIGIGFVVCILLASCSVITPDANGAKQEQQTFETKAEKWVVSARSYSYSAPLYAVDQIAQSCYNNAPSSTFYRDNAFEGTIYKSGYTVSSPVPVPGGNNFIYRFTVSVNYSGIVYCYHY